MSLQFKEFLSTFPCNRQGSVAPLAVMLLYNGKTRAKLVSPFAKIR